MRLTLAILLCLIGLSGCSTTGTSDTSNLQRMNPNPPASVSGEIAERVNRL